MKLPIDKQQSLLDEVTGCVAYHRDRGEDLMISHYASLKEFSKEFNSSWCEYAYLYKMSNHRWYFKKMFGGTEYLSSTDTEVMINTRPGYWYLLEPKIALIQKEEARVNRKTA